MVTSDANDSSSICHHCGALLSIGETCETIKDFLLDFEYVHSIPHRIHFLMVTCFLIQHRRYSDNALIWAQSMLKIHLDTNLTDEQVLRVLKSDGTSKRNWRFKRAQGDIQLEQIKWTTTIGDVVVSCDTVDSYTKAVNKWARNTLGEMQQWIQSV